MAIKTFCCGVVTNDECLRVQLSHYSSWESVSNLFHRLSNFSNNSFLFCPIFIAKLDFIRDKAKKELRSKLEHVVASNYARFLMVGVSVSKASQSFSCGVKPWPAFLILALCFGFSFWKGVKERLKSAFIMLLFYLYFGFEQSHVANSASGVDLWAERSSAFERSSVRLVRWQHTQR